MIRSPPFVYNIKLYEEHHIIEMYKDGYGSSTLYMVKEIIISLENMAFDYMECEEDCSMTYSDLLPYICNWEVFENIDWQPKLNGFPKLEYFLSRE